MGIYGSDVSSGLGLAPYFDFVVLPQIDEVCFIFHRNWEKPAKERQKQVAENGNCCIFHIKKSGSTNMIYLLLVWGCKTTWMLGRRHQQKK